MITKFTIIPPVGLPTVVTIKYDGLAYKPKVTQWLGGTCIKAGKADRTTCIEVTKGTQKLFESFDPVRMEEWKMQISPYWTYMEDTKEDG